MQVHKEILDAIAEGKSQTAACKMFGIPRPTFARWQQEGVDVKQRAMFSPADEKDIIDTILAP